jgi:hypothetical protein
VQHCPPPLHLPWRNLTVTLLVGTLALKYLGVSPVCRPDGGVAGSVTRLSLKMSCPTPVPSAPAVLYCNRCIGSVIRDDLCQCSPESFPKGLLDISTLFVIYGEMCLQIKRNFSGSCFFTPGGQITIVIYVGSKLMQKI